MISVHCLHDEASRTLTQMIVDAIEGGRVIPEPTDDVHWSGIRIFDEGSQRWLLSHRWPRGQERLLEREVYQAIKAIGTATTSAFHEMVGNRKLAEQLGLDPNKVKRPWRHRKGTP